MTNRLRVGVVGVGGIAQMMHLPTLAERPDWFELTAISDVSPAVLESVQQRYRVPFVTTDAKALCARQDVDAVMVLASGSHRDATLAAISAGKHVFVEKPLAYAPSEVKETAEAAKRVKTVTMLGYHKRYDPAFRKARDLVRSMTGLRYVEVTVLHPDDDAYRSHHAILPQQPPRPPMDEAQGDRETVSQVTHGPHAAALDEMVGKSAPTAHRVGAFLLIQSLIHDINLLRGVLGEPERVVNAHVWRGGMAQSSLTQFAGDIHANMSWISVPGIKNYEESVRFVSPDLRVTLVFPSPYLRHFPTPLTVERTAGDELIVESHTVSYEEAFRAEVHHFRECILQGKTPYTTVDDSLGDMAWMNAIAQAFK